MQQVSRQSCQVQVSTAAVKAFKRWVVLVLLIVLPAVHKHSDKCRRGEKVEGG